MDFGPESSFQLTGRGTGLHRLAPICDQNWNRYVVYLSHILPMLRSRRRWKEQVDMTLAICWCMDNELPRMTPRWSTSSVAWMTISLSESEWSLLEIHFRLSLGPNQINSVLAGSSWSRHLEQQTWTSRTHCLCPKKIFQINSAWHNDFWAGMFTYQGILCHIYCCSELFTERCMPI